MTEHSEAAQVEKYPTCFISYSHDSEPHKQAVLDFAQALRGHGIDVMIDRYVEHSPPQYWPQWMVSQIQERDFVIVVVTETYQRRFNMSEESGKGLGVTWEGAVINSHIYRNFGGPVKFIPVVFNAGNRRFIPFPLSETSYYAIEGLGEDQMSGLLHQLKNIPVVTPQPLGAPLSVEPKIISEVDEAFDLAQRDKDAAIKKLETLCDSSDPSVAATAAFHLGEIYHADQLYAKAIRLYQYAMEFGPRTPVYGKAQEALLNAVVFITALHGEGSARAALYRWLGNVQQGNVQEAWKGLDQDVRLALAQDWILANENHPDLAGLDRDQLATALSALEPAHPLAPPFLSIQFNKFRHAYGSIDLNDWGTAEKRRTYKIEYELVIMIPTRGEDVFWEPGTALPAAAFVMRRRFQNWRIAGFGDEIARPGWPPQPEKFGAEGVTFGTGEPPGPSTGEPPASGERRFLHW